MTSESDLALVVHIERELRHLPVLITQLRDLYERLESAPRAQGVRPGGRGVRVPRRGELVVKASDSMWRRSRGKRLRFPSCKSRLVKERLERHIYLVGYSYIANF
jgi:hypothetical protein